MSLIRASTHQADLRLEASAVVIGSGAGGGMMARELSAAGLDTILLEMGPVHQSSDFNQLEDAMLERLFQERGAQATADLRLRILTGIGLGGSTVHNTNLCKRTPEEILKRWSKDFGITGLEDLPAAFAATEAELEVKAMGPSELNANNRIFRRGVEALGWRGGFLSHNRTGCVRSGFCELGCAYDAKNNAAKVLIPKALNAGARVYEGLRVDRLIVEDGRVKGVTGTIMDPEAQRPRLKFEIKAKAVCLAAGALRSPLIVAASGLPDPHKVAGANMRCHPAVLASGIFNEDIECWRGIPQSYECTELLDHEDPNKRVWLLPGAAHPIGVAAFAPGFGPTHMAFMRNYKKIAAVIVMLEEDGSGAVSQNKEGRLIISHELTAGDRQQLTLGLQAAGKILLAAGAREIIVPYHKPFRTSDEAGLAELSKLGIPDYQLPLTAVHPMGTLAMGEDIKRAWVRSSGESWHCKGLFVCDASIFPSALGAPPQLSIYAFSKMLSKHVISSLRA